MEQAGKKTQEDLNKQLKEELSTEKKSPDELIKLLTEYINMSEAAEHPASQKQFVLNRQDGFDFGSHSFEGYTCQPTQIVLF